MNLPRIALFLVVLFLPYRVVAQQAKCDVDTYQKTLNAVFSQVTRGERVATVQVLPSFEAEWAIAFDVTPEGLVVSRISFRKQLWSQWFCGPDAATPTPSQRIELAKAIEERTPVPLARESAQRFIDGLARMDFSTDRCPRNSDGSCAYLRDGVVYVVQFKDGRSARLTDVTDLNGMSSENPTLSNWVTELLKESFPPVPSEARAHEEIKFTLLILSNGHTEKGFAVSGMNYESAAHVKVYLKIVHLGSRDDSKKEYDDWLKKAVKIIDQGTTHDKPATKPATTEDRAVILVPNTGVFTVVATAKDCEEIFTVVATAGTVLRTIQSCSLDAAVEFERQAKRNESVDDRWVSR